MCERVHGIGGMKHKVKHMHFIADMFCNGRGHCAGGSICLAQIPANADEEICDIR